MDDTKTSPSATIDASEPGNTSKPANDETPRAPSNATSSTISIVSRTSTLKYDQEPFDQYQSRVNKLCHLLWPSAPQVGQRRHTVSGNGAKARILDAVKVKKWRRLQSYASESVYTIERLTGGTYNRIIGIRVDNIGTKEHRHFILRVPRANMAEFSYIEREVAIMRFVRQKTTIPVAEIISFDPTNNNPLDSGYVIQRRLPGVCLHTVWDNLTHEQRCNIAKEIGRTILALQEVKHSFPGLVDACPEVVGYQRLIVRPFDIVSPHDVNWKQKISKTVSDDAIDTTTDGPLQWFGTQFGRWLAHELLADPSAILYWDYQVHFVEAAKQMDALGFLGDGQNCLCHFDLAARNVLVDILPDGSPAISGIVDWDSAVFAPTFVSCAPPSWLWTNPGRYDAEGNEANVTPTTAEQEEIKELFDEVVGFDWTWLAYRPGFRLARELFHFAQRGLPDGEASKKADRFLEEWAALYDTLMNPKEDLEDGEQIADKDMDDEDSAPRDLGPDEEVHHVSPR